MPDPVRTEENEGQKSIELLSYEDAYAQLQEVLARLEDGELPLEESLEAYERGSRLAALCARRLDEAQLRVHRWQQDGTSESLEGWQPDEA